MLGCLGYVEHLKTWEFHKGIAELLVCAPLEYDFTGKKGNTPKHNSNSGNGFSIKYF